MTLTERAAAYGLVPSWDGLSNVTAIGIARLDGTATFIPLGAFFRFIDLLEKGVVSEEEANRLRSHEHPEHFDAERRLIERFK